MRIAIRPFAVTIPTRVKARAGPACPEPQVTVSTRGTSHGKNKAAPCRALEVPRRLGGISVADGDNPDLLVAVVPIPPRKLWHAGKCLNACDAVMAHKRRGREDGPSAPAFRLTHRAALAGSQARRQSRPSGRSAISTPRARSTVGTVACVKGSSSGAAFSVSRISIRSPAP